MSNTNALSAKDRIAGLVDENSFVEIGAGITKRSTDFNMQEKSVPSDGVITGYGLIQNNPVCIQYRCIRTEWNNWRDARKKNCTYL